MANGKVSAKLAGKLIALLGAPVALALLTAVPKEESGRTVEASIAQDGGIEIKHISGRQYLTAYLDMVGVATACDGITHGLVPGKTYTEAECADMLADQLLAHAEGVMRCTPGLAISKVWWLEMMREGARFAAVSLAYNIGVPRYCGSTAAKRFNEGAIAAACTALTWWNRAGGRVVRGLVNRREREAKVCREGLGALS